VVAVQSDRACEEFSTSDGGGARYTTLGIGDLLLL